MHKTNLGEENMEKYFIAYGTNIKTSEISKYFTQAKMLGYGYLNDYAMQFVGYDEHAIATLVKKKGAKTPVAVWKFPLADRNTLANYEAFPYLYKRINATAIINGKQKLHGEIYVTKQNLRNGKPSKEYLDTLRAAYEEAHFDPKLIDAALKESNVA